MSGFDDKVKAAKTLGPEIRSFIPVGGEEGEGGSRTVNFQATAGLCFRFRLQ